MKKKLMTVVGCLALSSMLALAACTTPHTTHVDKNSDGKCDECGTQMETPKPPHTTHVDKNSDGKCDECGAEMETPKPPHTTHVDKNSDGKCDECGTQMETPKPPHTTHVDEDSDGKCDECGEDIPAPPLDEPFSVSYRAGYTPTAFAADVQNEITELGDGVHLVKNTVTKSNGQTSIVWAVEVDLNKANIAAGTKDNAAAGFGWAKAAPYATAQAWENATGGHVYASVNADFFGAYCVNAFVKDGIIIKDGHNDDGKYDYSILNDKGDPIADVPASAPMLFGVSGTKAQIAPIIKVDGDPETAAVKEQLVKAKLTAQFVVDGESYPVEFSGVPASNVFFAMEDPVTLRRGVAVKVDLTGDTLKVLEVQKTTSRQEFTPGDGIGWLLCQSTVNSAGSLLAGLNVGDELPFPVSSPDGTWDGYKTILGCRQALVTGDKIAPTVTKENSNGAQSPDVPRTAVGLKNDHTVVVFAVESLHYYGKNVQKTDPHGMNLPQLAEFIYYYGCTEAANFDGGGSTQLVVRADGEDTGRVVVRSADTGTSGLNDTRPVMNSLLVTSRKGD